MKIRINMFQIFFIIIILIGSFILSWTSLKQYKPNHETGICINIKGSDYFKKEYKYHYEKKTYNSGISVGTDFYEVWYNDQEYKTFSQKKFDAYFVKIQIINNYYN